MTYREFSFPSTGGRAEIRVSCFEPEGEIRAVVLLAHGMKEHIGRYHEFAAWLAEKGFAVWGHDMLGHGRSAADSSELGYFAPRKGWEWLLRDQYAMVGYAREAFPGKQVFLIAHSMSSFIARRLITLYPGALSGVILSGTADPSYAIAHIGKRLAQLLCLCRDGHYRSRLLELLIFGRGGPERWMSSCPETLKAYEEDPLCGFLFTASGYADFFRLLEDLALKKGRRNIPAGLPVLLASGMQDPIGQQSRGPLRVYNRFKAWGLKDVDLFFYKDDLHDILGEADRDEVRLDMLLWLERHLTKD